MFQLSSTMVYSRKYTTHPMDGIGNPVQILAPPLSSLRQMILGGGGGGHKVFLSKMKFSHKSHN